ncbi:MAG: nicotinate-nucleotide diphosphorylase [Planctomycetota bacterium]|nr:nicotinate-nucleotide diphosphorylase [Planctomycetota bacterium]
MHDLWRQLHIDEDRLQRLIALAKEEDLGAAGDITTQAVSAQQSAISGQGSAQIVSRADGVICGLSIAPFILTAYDAKLRLETSEVSDGDRVTADTILGTIRGERCSILSCERIVLNFVQHLSGIATQTRRFVEAVAGTDARIYDTRKTTPGWRDLEKYAVRCGGGHNHRLGLHDAILVKDNHLAGVPLDRLAQRAFEILNEVSNLSDREQQSVQRAAGLSPRDARRVEGSRQSKHTAQEQWHTPERTAQESTAAGHAAFVEFEVDSLEQFGELLKVVGIDVILLDNFPLLDLRRAVEIRDRQGLKDKLELEASGGITLDTVRPIAETGVERISVGALTHSAAAMDISLEFSSP